MRHGIRTGVLACLVALAVAVASAFAAQDKAADKSAKPAVNLNTATSAQLQDLPGIGPKTAERIIEYRTKNGPFKKIEELMNVKGIGEKSFLKMKDRLTVAPAQTGRSSQ